MRWLTWRGLGRWQDVGLLVMRVGLGLGMVAHGWPKPWGGPAKWEALGGAMASVGITFLPTFWGLCAALAEVFGGLLLAVGLATRPAAAALAFTMFIAAAMHLDAGDGYLGSSHAIEVGWAFVGLVFLGSGRYGVDARLKGG